MRWRERQPQQQQRKQWSLADRIGFANLWVAIFAMLATVLLGLLAAYITIYTPEIRRCLGAEPGGCNLPSPLELFTSKDKQEPSDKEPSGLVEEEIKGASWVEVPGTSPVSPSEREWSTLEGYFDYAYVDVNGIRRSGDVVIFDLIPVDGSYKRIEAYCNNKLRRFIRSGKVKSVNKTTSIVEFTFISSDDRDGAWEKELSEHENKILNFVCKSNPTP